MLIFAVVTMLSLSSLVHNGYFQEEPEERYPHFGQKYNWNNRNTQTSHQNPSWNSRRAPRRLTRRQNPYMIPEGDGESENTWINLSPNKNFKRDNNDDYPSFYDFNQEPNHREIENEIPLLQHKPTHEGRRKPQELIRQNPYMIPEGDGESENTLMNLSPNKNFERDNNDDYPSFDDFLQEPNDREIENEIPLLQYKPTNTPEPRRKTQKLIRHKPTTRFEGDGERDKPWMHYLPKASSEPRVRNEGTGSNPFKQSVSSPSKRNMKPVRSIGKQGRKTGKKSNTFGFPIG